MAAVLAVLRLAITLALLATTSRSTTSSDDAIPPPGPPPLAATVKLHVDLGATPAPFPHYGREASALIGARA